MGGLVARPLYEIGDEILGRWEKPYFGAIPYLTAIRHLESPTQNYGADTAQSIILYFLANANTWRGEDARRIKAELKSLLK